MRCIAKITCLVIVILVLLSCSSSAAGLRDLSDGWLLSTRDSFTLLGCGSYPGVSPNKQIPGGGVWAYAGMMQLFGMPEIPVSVVGLGTRLGARKSSWVFGGRWQKTGGGIFQEDVQTFSLGWEKHWTGSFHLTRRAMKIGSETSLSWSGLRFLWGAPALQLGDYTFGAHIWIPVWSSDDWRFHEARQERFKVTVSRDRVALVGVFEKKYDLGWALGMECSLALATGLGLTLRADPDTGSLGPGTLFCWGRLLVKTSHVVHPDLGLTHRITLTAGALGAVPW